MALALGCGMSAWSALVSKVLERGMADGIAPGRQAIKGAARARFRQCGGEPAASACSHLARPAVQAGLFWAHLGLGGSWGCNECVDLVMPHVRMEI